MLLYRIALTKYAGALFASGREARWNPDGTPVIYTAWSRSLACLENTVHRSRVGLSLPFSVMIIQLDDDILTETIKLKDLPADWAEPHQLVLTQQLGLKWINANFSAVLKVPSSIIRDEENYLLNPLHADFKNINLITSEPFLFDKRIKG